LFLQLGFLFFRINRGYFSSFCLYFVSKKAFYWLYMVNHVVKRNFMVQEKFFRKFSG